MSEEEKIIGLDEAAAHEEDAPAASGDTAGMEGAPVSPNSEVVSGNSDEEEAKAEGAGAEDAPAVLREEEEGETSEAESGSESEKTSGSEIGSESGEKSESETGSDTGVKAESEAESEAGSETASETGETSGSETAAESGENSGSGQEKNAVSDAKAPDTDKKEPQAPLHLEAYYDEKAFKKHGKRFKGLKIALVVLGVLMLIGYGVMTYISYRYFQYNTRINGWDYSFMTVDEVIAELDKEHANYQIHLTLRDGEVTIYPADIGLTISTENDIRNIKKEQNPFLWFKGFFADENKRAIFKITYDEDKLRDFIYSKTYFKKEKMVAPTNPTVELVNGIPTIIPGERGNTLDPEKVISKVKNMIPGLETEFDVEKAGYYVKPEYTEESERVVELRDKIQRYMDLSLIYQIADVNIQVKPLEIYDMLYIDTVEYYVVVSRSKVQEYVTRFADEHDTYGKERIFRTHDGKKVRLTNNQEFGWLVDREEETTLLYRSICRCEDFLREPAFSERAISYTAEGSDIGNTYVEVDLTYQQAFLYVDGKLICACDVISGLPSRGNDTPGGFYTMYGKWHKVVLRGPGYASPVDYWMPFNGGIGLHDASWQSKFGGELFKTRGSHGCVNLEYFMAETLYGVAYKGMSVVCYWRNAKYMVNEKDVIDDRKQQFFGL